MTADGSVVGHSLLDRHLLFVSGKGGVGKTTVAAALATIAAAEGRRTLVCEMDAKGALSTTLGDSGHDGFAPREVAPNLWVMTMNTEDALREYLRVVAKVPFVGRIGPVARTFDFVADAAPGVKEILAVGKLCYEVRERHFDLVVVDAEASGHVVAQLGAPTVIRDLVRVGMVRDQTDWMLDILGDPRRTGLVAVTTAEEMPVTEAIDLVGQVRATTVVDVAAVVANRVPAAWFVSDDDQVFEVLATSTVAVAHAVGVPTDGVSTVFSAAVAARARRVRAVAQLDHLRAALGSTAPVLLIPELAAAGLDAVVRALGEELP
ncbi:MAG: ArsA-related P-loop ATPase [Ilumatobacteraceae bacterium]